jgi:signal transduction histidine kinase
VSSTRRLEADRNSAVRAKATHEPATEKALRLLHVEDSEDDERLLLLELRRAGYRPSSIRVETQAAFLAALEEGGWEIVISDHTLPQYSGMQALHDLRARGGDVPFILVSGTIGEALAVDAMKAGAQDYVLKGDLTRLPAAIERELREAALRKEQAKMRERLMISERMASAGMLAAGVAHEINNPLAIAALNVDTSAEALARAAALANLMKSRGSGAAAALSQELAELVAPLEDAREALRRIRDIVHDVKLFSRQNEEMVGTVDLRRVADSSARMAWNEIRHRAKLVKRYGEIPLVQANESRLGQVVLNLLVNAAQAMPDSYPSHNEISIATKTAEDGSAVLEVADNGSGIPKENLERVFDAFFTTKPVGVGTGLGLAICRGIVLELGGRIELESEVGRGTMFRIVLPAGRASEVIVKAPPVMPSRQRGRVLVVDDEVPLGRALERMLGVHHDVTVLTGGEDAIRRIGDGDPFDVILLDVMMPDVSGMRVYDEVTAAHPEQAERIVFLTGGAFAPSAREFLERVSNPKLEKPIDMANLLLLIDERVTQALGKRQNG